LSQSKALVLFVDDELLVHAFVTTVLEDAGYEVRAATSGHEAARLLDTEGRAYAAVVTDINLQEGPDGWTLAKQARERSPGVPVVYVTGASGQEWAAQGVAGSVLLKKPFSPDNLTQALQSLIRQSPVR
jgi:CheY-like chemotaxis protein